MLWSPFHKKVSNSTPGDFQPQPQLLSIFHNNFMGKLGYDGGGSERPHIVRLHHNKISNLSQCVVND